MIVTLKYIFCFYFVALNTVVGMINSGKHAHICLDGGLKLQVIIPEYLRPVHTSDCAAISSAIFSPFDGCEGVNQSQNVQVRT
jgi:hypothetical protein